MLERGEADIALHQFEIVEEKYQKVDFSIPYLTREIKFVIEDAGSQPRFEAFTYPFSAHVWIFCLLTAIGATLFSKWITSSKTPIANIFVEIIGSILRQPLDIDNSSLKKIIWWATWLIWTTIISTSYSALFLSFLLAPPKQPTIKTFEELSMAVQHKGYHCYSEPMTRGFMLKSNLDYLKKLNEKCEDFPRFTTDETANDYFNKTTALITNNIHIFLMTLRPPNRAIVVSEDTLLTYQHAVAVRKDFCCMESFNVAMLSMLSTGLMQKMYRWLWAALIWPNELRRWSYYEEETHSLGMADLQYLFIVFLMGIALSVIVFLCEILIPKRIVNKYLLCPIEKF